MTPILLSDAESVKGTLLHLHSVRLLLGVCYIPFWDGQPDDSVLGKGGQENEVIWIQGVLNTLIAG